MKIGLGAKLTTGMTLTPQMQQAIKLLQLSNLELEQEVQQKLNDNPLLERIDDDNFESLDNFEKSYDNGVDLADVVFDTVDSMAFEERYFKEDWQKNSLSKYNDIEDENAEYQEYEQDAVDSFEHFNSDRLEMTIDSDWDEVYTNEPTGLSAVDTEELSDDYKFSTQGNIQDHIRWQLNFKHLSDIEMMIAEYLIDSMDDRGFINLATDELFHSLDTMLSFYQLQEIELEPQDIEVVIKQIQSCEPLGVGARNLSECLSIQLNKLPKDTPYLSQAKILLQFSDLIVSNNIASLLKQADLKLDEIKPSLDLIRTLNPNPAMLYEQSQSHFDFGVENYDVPDVLVYAEKGDWKVKLNPDTLPRLKVNQEYAGLIKRNDDSEQNVYLREHLYDARLFIKSIEERNQNLLKVANCIIQKQKGFLEHGVIAMQPMVLKDVADEVGLHESTVSRITTSKAILTPRGLFSLKYFFSSQVSNEDGEGVSSMAISAMIKQMIEQENVKKPLSDSNIVDRLKAQGIDIARRTVTKYREAMNIGSSTQRKQRF